MSRRNLIRRMVLAESTYLKLLWLRKARKRRFSDLSETRENYGEHHVMFKKLADNPEEFVENFNMKPKTFHYILKKIGRHIKKTSNFRKCIDPEERLAVTLKFLTTGATFRSISVAYRMSVGAVRYIVYTTCKVIWEQLGKKHMPTPTAKTLKKVAKQYYKKYNFPNCVGTVDKELLWMRCTQAPYKYHFKKKVLLPLTGIADTKYKFLAIDVGQIPNDSVPEGLLIELESNKIKIPPPEKPPGSNTTLPHVIIGTKFFPLKTYLLRPYAQRELSQEDEEFNKILADVHKVIETAFNILCSKWRYLSTEMKIDIEKITTVLRCICVLHNVIIDKEGIDEATLDKALHSTRRKVADNYSARIYNRSDKIARNMKDDFRTYLISRRQQDLLNGHDVDDNPAKRRKLSSSSSSSSESDSDSDEGDSDILSSNSSSDSDSDEESSSSDSVSSLDSEPEDDEDVDIEDEIDIKDEPLDDEFDDTDIKPDVSTIETYEIHELDEDSVLSTDDVKPDPDILQEIKEEENEELNTSSKSEEEIRIKEEPDTSSSVTQSTETVSKVPLLGD